MDPSVLLNKPKTYNIDPNITTRNITPKITKISNLSITSGQARKSSTKLLKVFEKGTYQKKTQLTVLNRYKRRLDSIQKQNDRSFGKKQKVKIKLPDIKKYVGNFFTPGSTNDPFKAIGALAAFNSFQKGSKGDWGGAIKSGVVAAGLFGGIPLLKRALKLTKGAPTPAAVGVGGLASKSFWGTPYAQTRAGKAYAGMQAERNMPKWLQRTKGGSASRFAQSNERMFSGEANVGDIARVKTGGRFSGGNIAEFAARRNVERGVGQFGARTGEEVGGKLISRALPFIGAAFSAVSAFDDFKQGNLVGGGLNVISAIADLFGQSEIALATAGLAIGSEMTYKKDDKLKQKTEEQKALVDKGKGDNDKLTFSKTLNSYDKAITKFEKFIKGFKNTGNPNQQGFEEQSMEYGEFGDRDTNPSTIQGDLKNMEATGGTLPSSSPITGRYGEQRPGHLHAGVDFAPPEGTPISVIQPGTVSSAEFRDNGYGNQVKVDHPGGVSSFYAHLSSIGVRVGQQIQPGTVIGTVGSTGHSTGPHLHFEVDVNGKRTDPSLYADKIFRFGGNIKVRESGQQSTPTPPAPSGKPTTGKGGRSSPPPTSPPPNTSGDRRNVLYSVSPPPPTLVTIDVPSPSTRGQSISRQLPYQQGYSQPQPMIVPYPVVRQQAVAPSESSAPMMFSGPSEQQLLNSFYKRVLLNTVQ